MKAGILGKKLGMTQIFTDEGQLVPVTAIEAGPCPILKVMKDRLMICFGDKKEKNTPNQLLSQYKKMNLKPRAVIKELLFDIEGDLKEGEDITVDIFKESDFVDISGTTKGKGFQGGVKRWNWKGGPSGHGSMHHRRVGSVGGSSYPSRVFKGQHMPGRMGNKRQTVQNLEIVKIFKDDNIILVKGAVPGAKNGYLEICLAKKRISNIRKEDTKKDKK